MSSGCQFPANPLVKQSNHVLLQEPDDTRIDHPWLLVDPVDSQRNLCVVIKRWPPNGHLLWPSDVVQTRGDIQRLFCPCSQPKKGAAEEGPLRISVISFLASCIHHFPWSFEVQRGKNKILRSVSVLLCVIDSFHYSKCYLLSHLYPFQWRLFSSLFFLSVVIKPPSLNSPGISHKM